MITLTDIAKNKLKSILKPNQTVLFGVLGGGCAGFEYDIRILEESEIKDAEKFSSQGLDFYVDNQSLMFLLGTTIDYKTDILSSQFVFKNPSAISTCGCGTSFSINS